MSGESMDNHNELLRIFMSRDRAKRDRTEHIKRIKVTTISGKMFDGDELSQQRMQRAITSLRDGELIDWTLADNVVEKVSRIELAEALRLAFLKQSSMQVLNDEK